MDESRRAGNQRRDRRTKIGKEGKDQRRKWTTSKNGEIKFYLQEDAGSQLQPVCVGRFRGHNFLLLFWF